MNCLDRGSRRPVHRLDHSGAAGCRRAGHGLRGWTTGLVSGWDSSTH